MATDTPTKEQEQARSILATAGLAIGMLSSPGAWREGVDPLLAALGEATGSSRVYVFENTSLEDGRLAMGMEWEWTAPGIQPAIIDPNNHGYPYDAGYQRYVDVLGAGDAIHGLTEDFPEDERADLVVESILSTAFLPLFAGGRWWGYIGYDDCVAPRKWSGLEMDALAAISQILGAAIHQEQVDKERMQAEAFLKSHVESIPAVTYIEFTDPNHALGYDEAYVSPQIETLFGYSQEEWLNDPDLKIWEESLHPEDRERVEEVSRLTAESGEPYAIEYRMLNRHTGEWVWVRDESHLVEMEGLQPYWHGVIMDISARKQAEEKLELQSRLMESISDVVIAVDADMNVTSWNRAAQVLYGWSEEEVLGSPIPEGLRYDPSSIRDSNTWDPFLSDDLGWRGQVVQHDRDGFEIRVETKGLPLRDAEGAVRGFVMVNREVAED